MILQLVAPLPIWYTSGEGNRLISISRYPFQYLFVFWSIDGECPNKSTNSSIIYLLVADVMIVVVSDRRRGKKDDQQKYYWWDYSITYLIHSISRERKIIWHPFHLFVSTYCLRYLSPATPIMTIVYI